MADVSAVNGYGMNMSLIDLLKGTSDSASSALSSPSKLKSGTTSGKASGGYGSYGSNMLSGPGKAAMERAISEIQGDAGGRVTFKDIVAHREKLQGEFSAALSAGLLLSGVDPEVEFSLIATPNGEIQVISDHPDKAKIEDFFKESPKMAEQFLYIQALGNLERANQGSGAGVRNWQDMGSTKAELQAQAMDIFFSVTGDSGMGYSSLMADFSDGAVNQYMLGANYTV